MWEYCGKGYEKEVKRDRPLAIVRQRAQGKGVRMWKYCGKGYEKEVKSDRH